MSEDEDRPLLKADVEALCFTRVTRRPREPKVVEELKRLTTVPARLVGRLVPELSEEALVVVFRACRARGLGSLQEEVMRELSKRIAPFVRAQLARLGIRNPEQREDVEQELAVLVFRALKDTGATGEFWEVRFWPCLKRRFVDVCRKLKRSTVGASEGTPLEEFPDLSGDGGLDSPERAAALRWAMGQLAPAQRAVVVWSVVERWTEAEIARMIGKSERTVRSIRTTALQKLRDLMGEDPDGR